jgi:hypothetical protein
MCRRYSRADPRSQRPREHVIADGCLVAALAAVGLQRERGVGVAHHRGDARAKEERRFEKLVGKAAGDEGLFARKRKERETQEKVAAAKEELRIAALPLRREYAEPGSIALPRLVFDRLQNPAAGSLDLPILGALVGLLFSFENRRPIMDGAVFEKRDDELVLVCTGPFDRLRFVHTVNPNDGMDDFGSSGRVKAQTTLRYLIRNKWLTAKQEEGHLTIRLGERAKKVREGTPTA